MPKPMHEQKLVIYPDTPHLIFCEGKDDYNFIVSLLILLTETNEIFSQFRAYDFEGINNLGKDIDILPRTTGFSLVKSLIVIRDAEKDATSACQSVLATFKNCGFAVPKGPCVKGQDGGCKHPHISTGFLLFPDCNDKPGKGSLEDLCLRILANGQAGTFLSNAEAALKPVVDIGKLPRPHKNRLHTYFSLTDEFVSKKIGQAAKAGAFNYDAPEIVSIKTFLLEMAGHLPLN